MLLVQHRNTTPPNNCEICQARASTTKVSGSGSRHSCASASVALPSVSLSCTLMHILMQVQVWGCSLFPFQILIDPHVLFSAPTYADQWMTWCDGLTLGSACSQKVCHQSRFTTRYPQMGSSFVQVHTSAAFISGIPPSFAVVVLVEISSQVETWSIFRSEALSRLCVPWDTVIWLRGLLWLKMRMTKKCNRCCKWQPVN